MQQIWCDIHAIYLRDKVRDRFGNISLNMFCNPKQHLSEFPKLKGRAAEVKSLAGPLLEVWGSKMDRSSPAHRSIRHALATTLQIEVMLSEARDLIKFPPAEAQKFLHLILDLLQTATALARHYNGLGQKLWNIVPKFHYLYHAAVNARFMNPRLVWTYSGEDYMQKIRKLVQSSCRGTAMNQVGLKVARKWTFGFTFRFRSRMSWFAP